MSASSLRDAKRSSSVTWGRRGAPVTITQTNGSTRTLFGSAMTTAMPINPECAT